MGYNGIFMDPGSLILAVGASGTLEVLGNYSTGNQYYMDLPLASSDTAVATVSGNAVTAVGVGSAGIAADGFLETNGIACLGGVTSNGEPLTLPIMTGMGAGAPGAGNAGPLRLSSCL